MSNKKFKLGPLVLANLIFVQSVLPYQAFALTGGPSQPEVQSFEPVSTNQMVDVFSGDFNYNIPLLTVPGPNGGYPINLAYHAGVGMEEEASWVGLGWNLNPGVLTRGLRGLPDDFNGDVVVKDRYFKPSTTLSMGGDFDWGKEIALIGDFEISDFGASLGIRYNNYRGFDVTKGMNASFPSFGKAQFGLGFTSDTESGTGVTPSLSLSGEYEKTAKIFGLNMSKTLHSRQGALPTNFGLSRSDKKESEDDNEGHTFGIGFSTNTYSTFLPSSSFRMDENSIKGMQEIGVSFFGVNSKLYLWAGLSQSKLVDDDEYRNVKSYGYLHSEHAGSQGLMDFNRENDGAIHHDSPRMPMPVYTNDIFSASGQGMAGSFRAMRTDVGVLGDPVVTSKSNGIEFSLEEGFGAGHHYGGDLNVSTHKSRSGRWSSASLTLNSAGYGFKDADYKKANPNFKPYYFKNLGEMSASRLTTSSSLKAVSTSATSKSKSLNIFSNPDPDKFGVKHSINPNASVSHNFLHRDEYVGDAMSFKSVKELSEGMESGMYSYLFPSPNLPSRWNSASLPLNQKGHLMGEVSVLNSSGMKYVYGLPAMNYETHTYAFAIDEVTDDLAKVQKTRVYNPGSERIKENDKGKDSFYEHVTTPSYAHSFHLTEIYSADYVDLTGDGPSKDDFGSYVKFEYARTTDDNEELYKWRAPFYDANLAIGHPSSPGGKYDDKVNFTYGEKEIYYLKSIETKTHKAVFHTEDREDARGVSSVDQKSNSNLEGSMKKLNKIELRMNNADETLIKTVHFQYDYRLCKGVYNHDLNSQDTDKGKLTLTNLWFSYGDNYGGALNRYGFTYNTGVGDDNTYSPYKMDRWGNYASTMTESDYNLFPYVDQNVDKATSDKDAGLWNLSQIHLPSGADIHVSYEKDTYSYVQDEQAMQMYEVIGIASKESVGGQEEYHLSSTAINKNKYLVVKRPKNNPLFSLSEATQGLSDVYFKLFMDLANGYKDYVEGYGKIDQDYTVVSQVKNESGNTYIDNGETFILLKLKPASLGKHIKTHPVRASGIRYIKNERPDVEHVPANEEGFLGAAFDVLNIFTVLSDFVDVFKGYYKVSMKKGNASQFVPLSPSENPYYKSFVRLNSVGKKYGGGHRVSKITLNDNWNTMAGGASSNMLYGQTYQYESPSGRSFGVCSYEPMVGSEENPFKKPLYYKGDSYIIDSEARYVEDTYGEQFQPSPMVGYSKVIVENITRDEEFDGEERITLKSGGGKQVHEYYTHKDFPVVIQHSDPKHKASDVKTRITLPFIGGFTTNYAAYSQGYRVYLNDMAGKPKRISTYKSTQDLFDPTFEHQPLVYTKYDYQTKKVKHYDGRLKTILDSEAWVMGEKSAITKKNLGETREFYVDSRLNNSRNYALGAAGNVDYVPGVPPLGFALFFHGQLQFSLDESGFSSLVSNEVVNRKGVLSKTTVFNEGQRVVSKNKVYDVYSGKPMLVSVNNDQYKETHALEMLAHQRYPQMGSAYESLGKVVYGKSSIDYSGDNAFIDFSFLTVGKTDAFAEGDVISIHRESTNELIGYYIIEGKDDVTLELGAYYTLYNSNDADEFMSNIDFVLGEEYRFKVIESGNTNQLTASMGSVVSLNENITGLMFGHHEIFQWLNGLQPLSQYIIEEEDLPQGAVGCTYDKINQEEFTLDKRRKSFNASNACPEYTLSIDYSPIDPDASPHGSCYENGYVPFTGDLRLHIESHEEEDADPASNNDVISASLLTEINTNPLPCIHPGAYYYFATDNRIDCQEVSPETGEKVVRTWLDVTTSPTLRQDWYEAFKVCYDVLDANAVTYKDDWNKDRSLYPSDAFLGTSNSNIPSSSEYRAGAKGIWKPYKNFVFDPETERVRVDHQGNATVDDADLSMSGVYSVFKPFNWEDLSNNTQWIKTNEMTKYSPYGFALESKNALDQYSAELIGFNHTVPVAVSGNARYDEIASYGFEEYPVSSDVNGLDAGNCFFIPTVSGSAVTTDEQAHTGYQSLKITSDFHVVRKGQDFDPTKTYVMSYWIKNTSACQAPCTDMKVYYAYTDASGHSHKSELDIEDVQIQVTQPIEGWVKTDLIVSIESGLIQSTAKEHGLQLEFDQISEETFIDDIRIHPFNSSLETFVYDPRDYKVMAELDNQNMATLYDYDINRHLFQVKKETTRGVKTLQTTRQNLPIQN